MVPSWKGPCPGAIRLLTAWTASRQDGLRRSDLNRDPLKQFSSWFQQALQAELLEPNAIVLGTTDGLRPSSRTVLLKAFNQGAFVFHQLRQPQVQGDRVTAPCEPAAGVGI